MYDHVQEVPHACIVVRNHIKHICVPELITQDWLTDSYYINSDEDFTENFVIASAQFAKDKQVTPLAKVKGVVSYSSRRRLPNIVRCDANAYTVI